MKYLFGNKRAATFLLVLLLSLVAGQMNARVLSHADYARSEPGADEVLSTPPATIRVWFTQELFRRAGENWLHVTGPDGARVDVGETVVDDNDRTLLTVSLAADLPDGGYRVEWRALSADDGHPEEGAFEFRVEKGSAGLQEEPAPAEPDAAPGDLPPTTSTPAPEPEATTTPAPAAEPAPAAAANGGGIPCLGAAPLALLVVGAVLTRRKVNK